MAAIYIPEERRDAWKKYKEKFGKNYPEYNTYMIYGNDWEAEAADIERRIRENDPAPEKELPEDVLF